MSVVLFWCFQVFVQVYVYEYPFSTFFRNMTCTTLVEHKRECFPNIEHSEQLYICVWNTKSIKLSLPPGFSNTANPVINSGPYNLHISPATTYPYCVGQTLSVFKSKICQFTFLNSSLFDLEKQKPFRALVLQICIEWVYACDQTTADWSTGHLVLKNTSYLLTMWWYSDDIL